MQKFERLNLVLADSDYYDQTLAEWTHIHCGRRLEVTTGLTSSSGFAPQPTGLVVEQSIVWLQWY
jgi:hypothetical protein